MSELTQEEIKWLKKVQRALNSCPSDRLAFYTIGDNDLTVYDVTKIDEISEEQNSGAIDFCTAVSRLDADFDYELRFKHPVEATCG